MSLLMSLVSLGKITYKGCTPLRTVLSQHNQALFYLSHMALPENSPTCKPEHMVCAGCELTDRELSGVTLTDEKHKGMLRSPGGLFLGSFLY